MKSTILHHWRAEYYDRDGDDRLVVPGESLGALIAAMPETPPPGLSCGVCVLRADWNPVEGVTDETLAYVGGGTLPVRWASNVRPLPQALHDELARNLHGLRAKMGRTA